MSSYMGPVKEQVRVHIRWMIRRDMEEVLDAETRSFEYAWTEGDFLRCLRNRNVIGMVAEQGEKVVGFMIYELHKQKLHILNFAVHPDHRRLGIGTQMVGKLVSKLSSHRRTRIILEVRETNLLAQRFFYSQGFRARRVLRSYYEDSKEDAYVMEYRLPDEDPVWYRQKEEEQVRLERRWKREKEEEDRQQENKEQPDWNPAWGDHPDSTSCDYQPPDNFHEDEDDN